MRKSVPVSLASIAFITLVGPVLGKDWRWITDESLSLPELVREGAALSVVRGGGDEVIYLVLDGLLFRCSRPEVGKGTCARAEAAETPVAVGGAIVSEQEGITLPAGFRGLPPTDLPSNPDKKRKAWDQMFLSIVAASYEVSASVPVVIDFASSGARTLALKIDAYGAPGSFLAVEIEPQDGGPSVLSSRAEIGPGGKTTLTERVELSSTDVTGGTAWRLVLFRPEDGKQEDGTPLVAEAWIMSIASQEDYE